MFLCMYVIVYSCIIVILVFKFYHLAAIKRLCIPDYRLILKTKTIGSEKI